MLLALTLPDAPVKSGKLSIASSNITGNAINPEIAARAAVISRAITSFESRGPHERAGPRAKALVARRRAGTANSNTRKPRPSF
ncbi:Hypothetical protein CINCED_3A005424 [Cinara cedri]|uniref:Uncharacterized protein n=1 Tax=Cinara cedri TaxID=506608 RepID=A0A5E4NA16_9HEMI|nr:Hypothetical protein CINCED_3A005424 [Cinara cedri]